jgi:hypothetical protein
MPNPPLRKEGGFFAPSLQAVRGWLCNQREIENPPFLRRKIEGGKISYRPLSPTPPSLPRGDKGGGGRVPPPLLRVGFGIRGRKEKEGGMERAVYFSGSPGAISRHDLSPTAIIPQLGL